MWSNAQNNATAKHGNRAVCEHTQRKVWTGCRPSTNYSRFVRRCPGPWSGASERGRPVRARSFALYELFILSIISHRFGTIRLPRKRCPVAMKGRDTLHAVRTFLQPRFLALAATASFFPRECRHRSDRYISLLQHRSDRYPSSSPIVVVLAVVLGVFAQQPPL